jgi:hypothetical protein
LDWFAVDADGHLAAFVTAGYGPVPEAFFDIGLDTYLRLVELVEERLCGTERLLSGGFTPYADRGLYAYDFRMHESGQYEIAAKPVNPLTIENAEKLGLCRSMFVEFSGRFFNSMQVVPEVFWACR